MYTCYWLCLHFHIDKWSIKGDETKSRTDKPFGCKTQGRGLQQLQKSVSSKHEVSVDNSEDETCKISGQVYKLHLTCM